MHKLFLPLLGVLTGLLLAGCTAPAPEAEALPTLGTAPPLMAATAEPTSAPQAEPTPAPEVVPFALGALADGRYRSTMLGITYTPADSWVMIDAEERRLLNGITTDAEAEALPTVLDLACDLHEGRGTVQITLERASEEEAAALNTLYRALAADPEYSEVTLRLSTVRFAGADRPCLMGEGTYQGMPWYEQRFVIGCGERMAVITLSSTHEDLRETMVPAFDSLD